MCELPRGIARKQSRRPARVSRQRSRCRCSCVSSRIPRPELPSLECFFMSTSFYPRYLPFEHSSAVAKYVRQPELSINIPLYLIALFKQSTFCTGKKLRWDRDGIRLFRCRLSPIKRPACCRYLLSLLLPVPYSSGRHISPHPKDSK